MKETWIQSLSQEEPLEKKMETHSSILAWKNPMEQRSLAGYSPWGHKESDVTEQLSTCTREQREWCGRIYIKFLVLVAWTGRTEEKTKIAACF